MLLALLNQLHGAPVLHRLVLTLVRQVYTSPNEVSFGLDQDSTDIHVALRVCGCEIGLLVLCSHAAVIGYLDSPALVVIPLGAFSRVDGPSGWLVLDCRLDPFSLAPRA